MKAFQHRVARGFWFALAVLFLIETWLWDHVKEWLRAAAKALGADRIEAWLTEVIRRLSPPATLTVFAAPVLMILPLKIYAVAQIATGHVAFGLAVILFAKTLGLGVTAFLFDLCRDKLLQMLWFAKFYAVVLRVRAWAHDLVAPAREYLRNLRNMLRARLTAVLGSGRSQFWRKLELVRLRARRGTGA
jgi:hypothetical protein